MTPTFIAVGAASLVAGVVVHLLTRRRNRADGGSGADAGTPAAEDTQVAPPPPPPPPSPSPSSPVGSTAAPVDRPRTER
jgi:hypothetical protein